MFIPVRPFEASPAFCAWLDQVCKTEDDTPVEPEVKTRKPRSPSKPRQTNPAKRQHRVHYVLVG